MKELARHLVRTRVPVKRPGARKLTEMAEESTGEETATESDLPQHSVYRPLDSWEPRFREPEERQHLEPEAKVAAPEPQPETLPEVPETYSGRRMNPRKKRKAAMSVSVSEEEADLLRRYAASKGMGFSAWARGVMFRAMGRKPPARPRRE